MHNVLLTGATGFLGSKIAANLLEQGFRVVALIRESSSMDRLLKYTSHAFFVPIIMNEGYKNYNELFSQPFHIDSIIHTATCYGRNSEPLSDIYNANLVFPLQLLIAGIQQHVTTFINADTFFNEQIQFNHNESIYVKTKKEFYRAAKDIVSQTGVQFVNMRIEHMYGPGDNEKKFIPQIISQLQHQNTVDLTEGLQKRDFVFVDDVAEAFVCALKMGRVAQDNVSEFQIGTGTSLPIKEVVEYLKRILKSSTKLRFGTLPYRPNEIMDSKANISVNEALRWHAHTPWQDGFKKTIML